MTLLKYNFGRVVMVDMITEENFQEKYLGVAIILNCITLEYSYMVWEQTDAIMQVNIPDSSFPQKNCNSILLDLEEFSGENPSCESCNNDYENSSDLLTLKQIINFLE